jgi:hypothetical protein
MIMYFCAWRSLRLHSSLSHDNQLPCPTAALAAINASPALSARVLDQVGGGKRDARVRRAHGGREGEEIVLSASCDYIEHVKSLLGLATG